MVVRYKGATSKTMQMPGGSPQGTLLGLILFLIMINDCGRNDASNSVGTQITRARKMFMQSSFYAKFIDDLTIAEAFDLDKIGTPKLNDQLKNILQYADDN